MVQPQPVLIEGTFDDVARTRAVTKDAVPVTVTRSQRIARLTDTFQWGYIGSGASQLAIELMLEAGATDIEAAEFQGRFTREVVGLWPDDGAFNITVEELEAFVSVYRTLKTLE